MNGKAAAPQIHGVLVLLGYFRFFGRWQSRGGGHAPILRYRSPSSHDSQAVAQKPSGRRMRWPPPALRAAPPPARLCFQRHGCHCPPVLPCAPPALVAAPPASQPQPTVCGSATAHGPPEIPDAAHAGRHNVDPAARGTTSRSRPLGVTEGRTFSACGRFSPRRHGRGFGALQPMQRTAGEVMSVVLKPSSNSCPMR